jgi:ankyrin repeat protein
MAAQLPDKDGMLPLHNIACYGEKEIIEVILDAFPEAIRHRSKKGNLPLHEACCADSSIAKLNFLIKKYPEALKVYNEEGYLPFHYACFYPYGQTIVPSRVTMVEHLINRMGLATLPLTQTGIHPLLMVCENNDSLDIILKLVQHTPELFQVKPADYECTPSPFKKRRV